MANSLAKSTPLRVRFLLNTVAPRTTDSVRDEPLKIVLTIVNQQQSLPKQQRPLGWDRNNVMFKYSPDRTDVSTVCIVQYNLISLQCIFTFNVAAGRSVAIYGHRAKFVSLSSQIVFQSGLPPLATLLLCTPSKGSRTFGGGIQMTLIPTDMFIDTDRR
jgi:hypothetical protein